MQKMFRSVIVAVSVTAGLAIAGWTVSATESRGRATSGIASAILDWNQIFIDTLIATNTANSASPRLGAIIHTAIFDAYNGIDRRFTPVFVHTRAPRGASPRAAVVGAAYTALAGLFPSPQTQATLEGHYADAVAALSAHCDGPRSLRGRESCLSGPSGGWRGARGGAGRAGVARERRVQRELPGVQGRRGRRAVAAHAAGVQLDEQPTAGVHVDVRPGVQHPVQTTVTADADQHDVHGRLQRRPDARAQDGLDAHRRPDGAGAVLEGNASVHWNQAANQSARANRLSSFDTARLFALLNLAMADSAFTAFTGKRFYGSLPHEVTWRPLTAITLADTDGNPGTAPDATWQPLITTPAHPEYPAGHPSLNGAASRVLLMYFAPQQTFTVTTAGLPSRTYHSITDARADGNNARVWGGMHYPSTVAISSAMGEAIADYINAHAMQ